MLIRPNPEINGDKTYTNNYGENRAFSVGKDASVAFDLDIKVTD
jgi:hypothetical protein